MSRYKNVVPFPTARSSGDFSVKLFIVFFYIFLAYAMTLFSGLSESGLTVLIVLGLLYNFFVRNRFQGQQYFKKNIVLLSIIGLLLAFVFKATAILFGFIGFLYWVLIARNKGDTSYFLRFHILTALISSFFVLMSYLILAPVIMLFSKLLVLAQLTFLLSPIQSFFSYLPMMVMGVFCGGAGWLSFSAIRGRTPELGVITDNVKYWA